MSGARLGGIEGTDNGPFDGLVEPPPLNGTAQAKPHPSLLPFGRLVRGGMLGYLVAPGTRGTSEGRCEEGIEVGYPVGKIEKEGYVGLGIPFGWDVGDALAVGAAVGLTLGVALGATLGCEEGDTLGR